MFEPSTAHLNPRSYARTRMPPWVRCVTDAVVARLVHTAVHTTDRHLDLGRMRRSSSKDVR